MASSVSLNNRLALLAGGGLLPVMVARQARDLDYRVAAFGFEGMMSPELKAAADAFFEFPFARLGDMFGRIEAEGITQAVTIGGIAQTRVVSGIPQFDDLAVELWRRVPDLRVDTVMGVLIEELGRRGITVLPAVDFLTDYFAPPGLLAGPEPDKRQWEDVRFGFRMAKEIGRLDVGQTVVVKERAVMAVEAVEGTDQAIRRGGALAKGGAVVVKTAKPGQDLRFDVPAVGRATMESMIESKAAVLAVEAGAVLMVEREELLSRAEGSGISVVGVRPADWGEDDG